METISNQLDQNIQFIKDTFVDCNDIVMREFTAGDNPNVKMFLIYVDNIVNGTAVSDMIMTNLMNRSHIQCADKPDLMSLIETQVVAIGEVKHITTMQEALDAVLLGDTVLFMDGSDYALQANTKGYPSRGVSAATTEVVVQGPKDAFTELTATNIVLIRRRIKDKNLKVKRQKVGQRSKTDVAVMYMQDLVREEVLQEVIKSLENINTDVILDSGYIEQLLEKRWLSPFPQLQMTERPDKAVSAILEGRVVMVVDNTPFVVIAPAPLNVFFQSAEDYYGRWEIMSFIRLMRYCAAFIAVALPGLYVALTVFHPSMLPTALALKIAQTRQHIPLPAGGEVLIMELAFELLREAGVRLPSPVSSTMGIVGGIIIGQSAIEAGLVSPSVVIVSALTGICTFVIPNVALVSSLRITKYLVLLLSCILGLYGFWLGLILLLIHLCTLKTFGMPYLYPFCSGSANDYHDWEDSIFRMPLAFMKKRPIFTRGGAKVRQREGKKQ